MTQSRTLKRLRRQHWGSIQRLLRSAYQDGLKAGLARAHGGRRRGRAIRADATVEGLVRRIEGHFGLDRYGFEVRIVHEDSGRRVAAGSLLRSHRTDD